MNDDSRIGGIEGHPSDAIHGFYRTAEGRDFLRVVYRRFVERAKQPGGAPFGELKLASIVADESFLDQDREARRTLAALTRWAGSQSELWHTDAEKTRKVLERLEVHLMAVPELKEILDDRAGSIRRYDFLSSISSFFHPPTFRSKKTGFDVLNKFEGVFEIFRGYDRLSDMEAYDMSSDSTYCRMSRSKDASVLLVQEFVIERPNDGRTVFRKRRGGFALLGAGGEFLRFMISHSSPRHRWLELYRPDDLSLIEAMNGHPGPPGLGDSSFQAAFFAGEPDAWKAVSVNEALRGRERVFRKINADTAKFIDRHFSGIMWDIPI